MPERSAKPPRLRRLKVCTESRAGYRKGCRCEKCTADATRANAEAKERYRALEIWKDPEHAKHGTVTGYTAYGCRCGRCSEAMKVQGAARRAKGLPRNDPRHGTEAAYEGWGCRCKKCRDVEATKMWSYKARPVPDGVEHGRATYSVYACRCEVCTAANAAYLRSFRA